MTGEIDQYMINLAKTKGLDPYDLDSLHAVITRLQDIATTDTFDPYRTYQDRHAQRDRQDCRDLAAALVDLEQRGNLPLHQEIKPMITLDSIQKGGSIKPPIIVIHGPPGIGKTTFSANAPAPIVVRAEDGLGCLQTDAFPVAKKWADIIDTISLLYQEKHGYQTVIFDSLSAIEPLIWAQVAADNEKSNIEYLGYGKGYVFALDYWQQFLSGVIALRDHFGILPILIAHSEISRFDSPEVDPYDRYQISLHRRAVSLLYERADIIGFCNWKTFVVKVDAGFDKKISRGTGTGERLLHLTECPAYIAKNRYGLPPTLPLTWIAFAEAMSVAMPPPAQQSTTTPAAKSLQNSTSTHTTKPPKRTGNG